MTLDCPANIEFLLWCHTRCEPHPHHKLTMYQELIAALCNAGVIERDQDAMDELYTTTAKGKAWVELLCSTPEPRVAFVDVNGNVIKT